MHATRTPNRLLLLAAFLACITLGFTLAVVLRERLGGTAEEDPCFGQGELVGSWEDELTQEDIDSVKGTRPELAEMEPGMVEYRRCRSEIGYEVIIDEKGHVFSVSPPTLAELEAYYKEHPEENPQNQMATADAKAKEEMFVTPALPAPETMQATVLAGCDPSWTAKDFTGVGIQLCYPPDWSVFAEEPEVSIGNDTIVMYFTRTTTAEPKLNCPVPVAIGTPKGQASLCEYRPNAAEKGQGHEVALPGRHTVSYFISEPTLENKWLALRIALAAEELP